MVETSGKCPKCESDEIHYDTRQDVDMSVRYPFTCKNCGFSGYECYDLNFSGFTDKDGNEI